MKKIKFERALGLKGIPEICSFGKVELTKNGVSMEVMEPEENSSDF